jgi:hypothetical protein
MAIPRDPTAEIMAPKKLYYIINSMKILGVDPGSRVTGFGLIETSGLKFSYLASGCIRTKGELTQRITTILLSFKDSHTI